MWNRFPVENRVKEGMDKRLTDGMVDLAYGRTNTKTTNTKEDDDSCPHAGILKVTKFNYANNNYN